MGYKLEKNDLNVELNFAIVCRGKMCDFVTLREKIRADYPGVQILFNTISADYLFILKKNKMTPEQLEAFKRKDKSVVIQPNHNGNGNGS